MDISKTSVAGGKPPHAAGISPPIAWGEPFKLVPLLGFFLTMALWKAQGDTAGDGWRYLLNARHILEGYFAGPDTYMFWNGPGYPLFLAPFLKLGIPLALARAGNAVFLYLAVVHIQGVLRTAGIEKRSLLYAYAMGCILFLHGPLMGMIMTESLSVFLVSGAAYHFCVGVRGERRPKIHLVLAGLHLGYLALTKVFFGYVLELGLLLALGAWLWTKGKKKNPNFSTAPVMPRSAAIACGMGLLLCIPYLTYTGSKTGKINLWGNSGGFQLYYMSLPEKEYLGDWLNFEAVLDHPEYFPNHVEFIRETLKLDWVSQNAVFTQAAVRHCRENPKKCVSNWRANINRMVFGFPNTYYPGSAAAMTTGNRAFIYALPFALLFLMAIPGWLGRRLVPPSIHVCLIFALISLGGMSLVCAIPRQVFPLLPLLGIWCAVVFEKALRVQGRWNPG